MTQKKKMVLTLLLLCGIIAAAYLGYQALSRRYLPQQSLPEYTQQTQEDEPSPADSIPERVSAPDFTMTDQDGNLLTLESLKGKPIVINFWATWCGFCVQEMPDFDKAYQAFGDDVTFIMLNVTDGVRETREKAQAHYQEQGYTFPIYFDDQGLQGSAAYGVSSYPTTYFIDRNGNLVTYAVGMINGELLQKGITMALEQDAGLQDNIKNTSWCTMDPVYSKITAEDAKRMMGEFGDGSGYTLLDVRTQQEYSEKRISGAMLIPDYELAQRAQTELTDKTRVIFVYCRSGRRSEEAAKQLVALGYNHVYDFGGINDWQYETENG